MIKKIIIFSLFFILFGCKTSNPTVINTNQYYQKDYNYFCFDGNKTWSEIVICQRLENQAEHTQNKITNDLLIK